LSAIALCQAPNIAAGETSSLQEKANNSLSLYLPDVLSVPPKMLDVMRASEMHYLEGSTLIKSGDSAKARGAFDKAVDGLLQSDWDVTASTPLNQYFADLILRIQRDESRYLRADDTGEKPERAVVDELNNLDLIPIQVDPSLTDALEADILNSKYDIPVTFNENVRKSLTFWLGTGRKFFIDGLVRSGRYKDMIERIFREESVPRDVMYLAQVESLFKTNALSSALAKGIWQFTKGTAVRYGLKIDRYIDERSDPEKSTRAAARYLNDLYAMFKDWNLVLAAYNWGEGAIQQLVEKTGINDFWKLSATNRKMPNETKNHVPLIMASIILARNPGKFGLPTELETPPEFDQIDLHRQINIKSAAAALNIPLETLTKLNPALRTNYTPPDATFTFCVPAGMGENFVEKLASLPEVKLRADPDFDGKYKVKKGDTLSGIAARYRVSVEDLKAANNIKSPQSLKAGATLMVPTQGTTGSTATASRTKAPTASGGTYTVKKGDTLSEIASQFGVSVASLQQVNNIRPQNLQAGDSIRIPAKASSAPVSSAKASTETKAPPKATSETAAQSQLRRYRVKQGDTLASIAVRHGVSVAEIQKLNSIRSPKSLQVGTWLQIPSAVKLAAAKAN
jgi:membrane-bound lytic murein transglycosylase D